MAACLELRDDVSVEEAGCLELKSLRVAHCLTLLGDVTLAAGCCRESRVYESACGIGVAERCAMRRRSG
eukprot:1013439-Alexandrium_andersonii.AAC.1